MTAIVGVAVLLGLIWAAVLVPPAVVARRERQEAFMVSLGHPVEPPSSPRRYSSRVQRRRQIAGGLLAASVATLVAGLLPTFRILLVVHLFLLDSLIGYLAVLAHQANRAARAKVVGQAGTEEPLEGPVRVRPAALRPALLA